jgi:CheY-like chemotaxis protein
VLPIPERPPRRPLSDSVPLLPSEEIEACVLVVEDEEPIARMICESLRECGHVAEFAGDVGSALDAIRTRDFDLIIADLRLPGMGGDTMYDVLAERHPGLVERLLLISGDTAGDAIERVVQRTGCPVLTKPFDVEALHRAVHERLAANR